ncbi:hypothetical protein [Chryseobacterium sp. PMSZPI]|uniref:hypothetical protein n=1 Tax=Chryseobacterium sp. PMSZPI TaxID=1033900 RepID=UPI000C328D5C|nr:hypothetical protein [Chryseobacterium sp. PMSZPI]PKF75099.1 hypothetical protein CW752_05550 [Chryseobacterium sp. PMSZPI]
MKKIIIHSIPVLLSFIWLFGEHDTFNPITLKGPEFLTFYLILLLGFYSSIFLLKIAKESISKITFYGMSGIFVLGIIKLIRGLLLGRPIGFLMMILILECIVGVLVIQFYFKNQIK